MSGFVDDVGDELKRGVNKAKGFAEDTVDLVVDSVSDPANAVIPGAGTGAPTKEITEWAAEGAPSGPGDTPSAPTRSDAQRAADAERKRAALAGGRASTIMTGGSGLMQPAPTARKVLLGQ